MRWLVDLVYLLAAVATSPVWLYRMIVTGKIRTDWPGRLGAGPDLPEPHAPRLLLHAVSVGEVNAIRLLVDTLDETGPDLDVVVATTTDTGYARAVSLFAERHAVVRYPFDFSFAVARFLRRVRPDAVALVELEVWPGFVAACRRGGVPVCVVNGRLSARSARRYRRIRPLLRPSFARLAWAAVQDGTYAERFRSLGVPADRVHVTGTMKWDTARISDSVPGAEDLADALGIDPNLPLVVVGSSAPEEHRLLVEAVPKGSQLLCAPRKPEWFDQAATDLPGCARRSVEGSRSTTGRFLLDTIGELRKAYALADVVVVGRSFGERHGSDMCEPVALGRATIVGPAVSDFQEMADALIAGGGLVQTDRPGLAGVLRELLEDPERRRRLGEDGRAVIRREQGATAKHAEMLRGLIR